VSARLSCPRRCCGSTPGRSARCSPGELRNWDRGQFFHWLLPGSVDRGVGDLLWGRQSPTPPSRSLYRVPSSESFAASCARSCPGSWPSPRWMSRHRPSRLECRQSAVTLHPEATRANHSFRRYLGTYRPRSLPEIAQGHRTAIQ
jgi:hypothetical protein